MLSLPVSAQSAFCALKKQIKTESECLRFLVLDQFKWSKKVSWKALPNLWGCLEFNSAFSSGVCYRWAQAEQHSGLSHLDYAKAGTTIGAVGGLAP